MAYKKRRRYKRKTKIKKTNVLLAFCILCFFYILLHIFSSKPNNSTYKSSLYATVLEQGIDVSYWQGEIDWGKVKTAGIDFAIIRTGYGSYSDHQRDERFYENMNNAISQDIKVGVYHYSHATTLEQAINEAQFVLSIIDGYTLQYPIYYDLEDSVQENLSTRELTDIALAFLETIENAGYQTGIYANMDWLTNRLYVDELTKYEIWIANYSDVNTYQGDYGVWQYSQTGQIDGINGFVDLNNAYKKY